MNRRQRNAHALLWPALLFAMAAICVGAIAAKAYLDNAIAAAAFDN
ncbi:MAG: hypothetical protein ACK4X1_16210 [Terricaulis sp.]